MSLIVIRDHAHHSVVRHGSHARIDDGSFSQPEPVEPGPSGDGVQKIAAAGFLLFQEESEPAINVPSWNFTEDSDSTEGGHVYVPDVGDLVYVHQEGIEPPETSHFLYEVTAEWPWTLVDPQPEDGTLLLVTKDFEGTGRSRLVVAGESNSDTEGEASGSPSVNFGLWSSLAKDLKNVSRAHRVINAYGFMQAGGDYVNDPLVADRLTLDTNNWYELQPGDRFVGLDLNYMPYQIQSPHMAVYTVVSPGENVLTERMHLSDAFIITAFTSQAISIAGNTLSIGGAVAYIDDAPDALATGAGIDPNLPMVTTPVQFTMAAAETIAGGVVAPLSQRVSDLEAGGGTKDDWGDWFLLRTIKDDPPALILPGAASIHNTGEYALSSPAINFADFSSDGLDFRFDGIVFPNQPATSDDFSEEFAEILTQTDGTSGGGDRFEFAPWRRSSRNYSSTNPFLHELWSFFEIRPMGEPTEWNFAQRIGWRVGKRMQMRWWWNPSDSRMSIYLPCGFDADDQTDDGRFWRLHATDQRPQWAAINPDSGEPWSVGLRFRGAMFEVDCRKGHNGDPLVQINKEVLADNVGNTSFTCGAGVPWTGGEHTLIDNFMSSAA